jgi:tryptophan synthase alpha chain
MPYLMGGYPDLSGSLRVAEAYAGAGAEIVELGVPFSDPLADGPVIQLAGQRALAAGATFDSVVEEVAVPLAGRVAVVLMAYVNQVLVRGFEGTARLLADAGVAGLIVPDLPADEADDLRAACDAPGIALVSLVAPTTTPERLERAAAAARGFVYVVSVTGVTGEREAVSEELKRVVAGVRGATSVPVAVGFGIATPEQASRVAEIADGVIVGSRLVRMLEEAPSLDAGLAGVKEFLRETREALV